MDDAGQYLNEAQLQQLELEELNKLARLSELLSTEWGRALVWEIFEWCHLLQISYVGNVNDTIFREGERNIGNKLLQKVFTANAHSFNLMRAEAEARQELLEALGKESGDDDYE